jgi:putative transposase
MNAGILTFWLWIMGPNCEGVQLYFIDPGKPNQNAYIESFNGRFRDECLNQHWFTSITEAREIIENWKIDYTTEHPHSSLKYKTPEEFAAARPFDKTQWAQTLELSDTNRRML